VTTLWLASTNPGKIREFNRILESLPGDLRAALPPRGLPEVAETGPTFEANARIKAEALSRTLDGWVVADDSGLVVDALAGEPGIRSARYGEPDLPGLDDRGRVRLLLERLEAVPDPARTARFVCALALARAGRTEAVFGGECEGRITREPRGQEGFGYDPVFLFEAAGRTFAELPPEDKDRFSHRAKALWRLAAWLTEQENRQENP
jgi:XTP/dITP diphosphohydrolase